MKIAVTKIRYARLSIATLLAQRHPVIAADIVPGKVEKSITANRQFRMSISKNIWRKKI